MNFAELRERRRWLVAEAAGDKRPVSGWQHPRSFELPNGAKVRKVVQLKTSEAGKSPITKNGIRVTSTTPETWLTYAEALAVCREQLPAGHALPAYVHGNPARGFDDQPTLFLDLDMAQGGDAQWAKEIIAQIGRHLPSGWPWMRSVSGRGPASGAGRASR